MVQVEQEKLQSIPEDVKTVPEVAEIPREVEQGGVKPVPAQVTAQVTDDTGQPMMQTPATQTITIQLPADDDVIAGWTKGPVANSVTWLGIFWERMVKKAKHFGWKITRKTE